VKSNLVVQLNAAARREDTRAFLVGGTMVRFFPRGRKGRAHLARIILISSIVGLFSVGCTRLELEDKASAYNAAIGESNNRQILLNAVRASQRAPMSFVGFGDMAAQPNFSGSVSGSWEFDPFGLTKTTAGSTLNATGGFTNFQMSNLNNQDFITALQKPLKASLIQHFIDLNYPKELIALVFVQKYVLTRSQYNAIQASVKSKCAQPVGRAIEICERLAEDQAAFLATGCREFVESGSTITRLNTGREFCSMNRFQTFVRQLRLLNLNLPYIPRTAEGMLYWLGELIAAQNYSVHPYVPEIYMETPDGHRRLVPLFVVRRGPPVVPPAVVVFYQGEVFYIPRPELGTIEEARSLEVLDIVWWAMVSATTKGDLPKSTTVTLVNAR